MKYLQLYDHLGNLIKEFNVYVEGADFEWVSPKPECIWLGTIWLSSVSGIKLVEPTPEPLPLMSTLVEPESFGEPEPQPEPKPDEAYLNVKAKCSKCGWEGLYRDCSYGHDDFLCPKCGVQSLREVEEEPSPEEIRQQQHLDEAQQLAEEALEEAIKKKELKDEPKKPKSKCSGRKRAASPTNVKRVKKLSKDNS